MSKLESLSLIRPDVETCRDLFKIGYDAFEPSRIESLDVQEKYHNRQWTADQLNVLSNRGQPAETFNIVKLFSRMVVGYYSTVVNTAVANPMRLQDVAKATVANDALAHAFRMSNFIVEGNEIKLDAILSGLMCAYMRVEETGRKDRFGRPIRQVRVEAVNSNEIVMDPMSKKADYSDAKHQHRYKWLSESEVINTYGLTKAQKLVEYYNHLSVNEAEFEYSYNGQFTGQYKIFNNYLIVHSIIIDHTGKAWSIHWCDDVELYKKEVTFRKVKFPYRIYKLQGSAKTEHYGIFREVIESQKAVNQALIKIQLMVNTQKAYVETSAVDNIDDFTDAFNRVSAVIEVNDLNGIKIDSLSKEVLDQYTIIDKAFSRIQQVLGINDSFLGMAFASDSGRKVKLQQNATIIGLHYLTNRIQGFYKALGSDMLELIKQYYTAEDTLRITDDASGDRWVTVNKPLEIPTGMMLPTGEPEVKYAFEYVEDEKGKIVEDKNGNYLVAPIPEEDTEIKLLDTEITVDATAYNDEDEKNQLMLETVLSGTIGQMLSKVNPSGYFRAAGLSLKSYKTRNSPEISKILEETAEMLKQTPEAEQAASEMAQGGNSGNGHAQKSGQLKLPQNTNEGA